MHILCLFCVFLARFTRISLVSAQKDNNLAITRGPGDNAGPGVEIVPKCGSRIKLVPESGPRGMFSA